MGHAPGKTVLITGASSGIGRACALRMDRAGWRAFATVRRPSDARQLQSDASERLHPILLDVTDAAQISDMSSSVDRLLGGDGLDGLVNNAGIPSGGLLEFLDPDDLRRWIERLPTSLRNRLILSQIPKYGPGSSWAETTLPRAEGDWLYGSPRLNLQMPTPPTNPI